MVALQTLTNFPISIKTLFEGTKFILRLCLWYYVPKYMLVSTPLFFLIGLGVFILILPFVRKHFNLRYLLIVLFVALFPLIYGFLAIPPLYGGGILRFIYPPLLALSAVGFEYLLRRFQIGVKK
ncbi:MAG: hypothetical protein R2822_07825 [Spirosomataceae bacterium]